MDNESDNGVLPNLDVHSFLIPDLPIANDKSGYDAGKIALILAHMASGMHEYKAVQSVGMSWGYWGKVKTYLVEHEAFTGAYNRAQELWALNVESEMISMLKDNRAGDLYNDGKGIRVNNANVHRDKSISDTYRWLLSKKLRSIYGEKVEHTGPGGGELVPVFNIEVRGDVNLSIPQDKKRDEKFNSREVKAPQKIADNQTLFESVEAKAGEPLVDEDSTSAVIDVTDK